jgi:hypothetical protein
VALMSSSSTSSGGKHTTNNNENDDDEEENDDDDDVNMIDFVDFNTDDENLHDDEVTNNNPALLTPDEVKREEDIIHAIAREAEYENTLDGQGNERHHHRNNKYISSDTPGNGGRNQKWTGIRKSYDWFVVAGFVLVCFMIIFRRFKNVGRNSIMVMMTGRTYHGNNNSSIVNNVVVAGNNNYVENNDENFGLLSKR